MKVGVIGASGQLGSALMQALRRAGVPAIGSDRRSAEGASVQEVFRRATIVHLCVPNSSIVNLMKSVQLRPCQRVVLHDSVMALSQSISKRHFGGSATIVHMLMNQARTVCLAPGFDTLVALHFVTLGFVPRIIELRDHDRIMARSQAPLALLLAVLQDDLAYWSTQGLLTPSAAALYELLLLRGQSWTESTRRSVLKNKEIQQLLNDMRLHIQGIDTHGL